MIALDSASGFIQFPKIFDYQLLMDNIKNFLQINDELFNYLYFSYIDEKDQERVRLNPQVFDDFISQEFPILSIGFLDNVDENIMDQFKDIIDINKKRFQKINFKVDEDDPSIIHKKNINNSDLNNEKENEIKLSKNSNSSNNLIILEQQEVIKISDDEDSKKENQLEIVNNKDDNIENKENINNNCNIINKKISGFNLLDSDNIKKINNIIDDANNNSENKFKKEESINIENINSSDINLIKFDKKYTNEISVEENKEIEKEENEFDKNIENIITSNLEDIKDDIIHTILLENSKIQNPKINKVNPMNNYIHKNYECNICKAFPIKGIRYHCLECNDFDICEKCEARINHKHPLFKIKNDKSCQFKN